MQVVVLVVATEVAQHLHKPVLQVAACSLAMQSSDAPMQMLSGQGDGPWLLGAVWLQCSGYSTGNNLHWQSLTAST